MYFTGFDHNLKSAVGTSLEWLESSKYHFLSISEQKMWSPGNEANFTLHWFVLKHGRGAPDSWPEMMIELASRHTVINAVI